MKKVERSSNHHDSHKQGPKAETSAALNRLSGAPRNQGESSSPGSPASSNAPRAVRDQGHQKLRVASYNVAGGNATFNKNYEKNTSDLAAEKLVHGVDVMSMQEVSVNGKSGPIDYNRELLKDVFAEKYALADGQVQGYFYDSEGHEHRMTDKNRREALQASDFRYEGGGHSMEMHLERFDQDGHPQPWEQEDGHPITVYQAHMDDGQEYNAVFVDSGTRQGAGYGNSVVLGPKLSIRDEQGNVRPDSIRAVELGHDPEDWKPEQEREIRTAVGVRFTTADGQEGSAFSAHLSTESITSARAEELKKTFSEDQVEQWRQQLPKKLLQEQRSQMRNLQEFTRSFGGDRNVIVGGDFNNHHLDQLMDSSGPLREGQPQDSLDHLLYSSDIQTKKQEWEKGEGGFWDFLPFVEQRKYSDHDMLIEDITL